MANCETNILDLPLRITCPALTDVIMITHSDGTTEIVTWGTLLGCISPTDIEFEVLAAGAPVGVIPKDGDATYQNDEFIGRRVRVYRGAVRQSLIDRAGYHYAFNSVSGIITFTPNLTEDELIQIEIY